MDEFIVWIDRDGGDEYRIRVLSDPDETGAFRGQFSWGTLGTFRLADCRTV